MKKTNILKIAFTLVLAFVIMGAYAQTHNGTAVTGQANVANYGNDGATYMVEGTTIPVYALPDATYHSDWDYATADWTLTDGFIWAWSEATTTLTFSQNNVSDNYVEITAPAASAAAYTVQVTETAPAAYGGCTGAATNLTVNVVVTPSATLGALDGTTDSYCVGDGGIPATIPVTISDGWQNYRLVWTLEIATLGTGLVKDEWFDTDMSSSLGGALAYAEEYTTAAPEAVAASGVHDIMSVASFTAIDPDGAGPLTAKPTVYTYTLTSINDQALRFGDFITLLGDDSDPSAFTYNAIGETYSVQINPAPTTGPIYHIPTTWAN